MKIFTSMLPILFVLSSCYPQHPKTIVPKADKLWMSGNKKESCKTVYDLKTGSISKWPAKTAFNFIRLYTRCNYFMGKTGNNISKNLPSPYKEYFQAMSSIGNGRNLVVGEKALNSALKKYNDIPELNYRLGLFYLMDEKFSKACPLIEKAIKLSGETSFNYRISLARCFLGIGKQTKIPSILAPLVTDGVSKRQIAQGRKIIESAKMSKRLIPLDLKNTIIATRNFLKKGNSGKALTMLETKARENPQFPVLHYLMAVIHMKLGNKSDSIVELHRSIALDPQDGDSWLLLGSIYLKTPQFLRSQKMLLKALKYNPLNLEVWVKLRTLSVKKGDYSKAVFYQKGIISLHGLKKSMNQFNVLASLYEKENNYNKAIKIHKMILKKLGGEAGYKALKSLARLHFILSSKDYENSLYHRKLAKKYIKKALKLRATDPQIRSLAKKLGVKPEDQEKSPFEEKLDIKGAKHINKKDQLFR